jgi:hypothetical protein
MSGVTVNKKQNELQRKNDLNTRLNSFIQSLGEVFVDITALEVNTMVVEEITGDKFIPWEVYRDVFPICQEFLEKQPISPNLYHRYLDLRKQLELQYILCLTNPNSEIFDQQNTIDGVYNTSILTDKSLVLNESNTYLPNPINSKSNREMVKVQKLLSCSHFLRALRKIGEVKSNLDSRNLLLLSQSHQEKVTTKNSPSLCLNTIYAQTVVQLDGDVVNRFNQEILDHPQQDLLIKLHQESVNAGQQQWKGLLGFMMEIIQGLLRKDK